MLSFCSRNARHPGNAPQQRGSRATLPWRDGHGHPSVGKGTSLYTYTCRPIRNLSCHIRTWSDMSWVGLCHVMTWQGLSSHNETSTWHVLSCHDFSVLLYHDITCHRSWHVMCQNSHRSARAKPVHAIMLKRIVSAQYVTTLSRINHKNKGFLDNVCRFSIRLKKLTHVIKINRFRRGRVGGAGSSETSTRTAICM